MDHVANRLSSHSFVMALDYGQFYIDGGAADEDLDTQLRLLDRALAEPPFAGDETTLVVLSPHQNNFEMPVTAEVWDARPPDDRDDWQQTCEARLRVGPDATVSVWSFDFEPGTVPVPAGRYLIEVSGRGFVNYGWPGSTTPGDVWRIRLWPDDGTDPLPAEQWDMPGYGVPEGTPLTETDDIAEEPELDWIGVIESDGSTHMVHRSELEARAAAAERAEWGGEPIPELREHGIGSDLARYDRPLAEALTTMNEPELRRLSRWCARRAFEHAGIAERPWVAPALAAMDAGRPLPPPFDDLEHAHDRLARDEFDASSPSALVGEIRTDAARPGNPFDLGPVHRPSFALNAVVNACDPDPFTAAVTALQDAAFTFGPEAGQLFGELRAHFAVAGHRGEGQDGH